MNRPLIVAALLFVAPAAVCAAGPSRKSAPVDAEQVERDLDLLTEHKIVSEPDYWRSHLVAGGTCDGAKVATLLVELAKTVKPVKDHSEAIAVLAAQGFISSPEYWRKNAVPGLACDAGNVAAILNRVAEKKGLPPPKSANAQPLAATDPLKLKDSYDVVVAGAGMGGCGAAIQAARMGRSVLLLEETDWIGGQSTAAGVTSMDEGVKLVRERGLYRELCGLISAHYRPLGIDCETAYWHGHLCFEPRVGRTLLLKMLGNARTTGALDLALRSRVTKVLKQGDAVTGVEIAGGKDCGIALPRSIACKVLIDATEWGDVIPLAGARYRVGNCTSDAIDPARHTQDMTWTATVKQYPQGVPPELRMSAPPPDYQENVEHFRKTLQLGDLGRLTKPTKGGAWSWAWFIGYRGMPDSTRPPQGRTITRTHLNYNNDYPTTVADIENPESRQAACRAAMRRTLCLLYYIQTELKQSDWSVANDEGYDTPCNHAQIDALLVAQPELKPYRAILVHFSVMPYVRESRRIIGLHTLTAREIERKPGKPTQFSNTVALGDYAVDLHGSMTPEYLEMDLDRAEDMPHGFGERGLGPFAIPFECFIPEKLDGFLPAEKNLSQSRLANGATRLQPSTLLTGQAAGAIAALAVEHHVQPRALDPLAVQKTLLDAGCTLVIQHPKAPWGSEKWKQQQLETLHPHVEVDNP